MVGRMPSTAWVSAGLMPCSRIYQVMALYMAPVLMNVYPSRSAMSLATVDFPEAAGPSMAIAGCMSVFICCDNVGASRLDCSRVFLENQECVPTACAKRVSLFPLNPL